MVYLKV